MVQQSERWNFILYISSLHLFLSALSVCWCVGQAEAHRHTLPNRCVLQELFVQLLKGILLLLQQRSKEVKFLGFTETSPGSGHRWQQHTANRCCIFQLYIVFALQVGTIGAMQSRFKGLCFFITWLQLPQVL